MDIKEFALLLRNRLLNGVSPEIIAREINNQNFTEEQKRQIIDYIEYINSYDIRMRNCSNSKYFLDLVSEVKKRVIAGFYILYDVNGSGINHIYEVTSIDNEYYNKNIPICNRNDCSTKGINITANIIPYKDLVTMIINIIKGIENNVRICGQCMMSIILEMQNNNIGLEGINFSDALEFCRNLDR